MAELAGIPSQNLNQVDSGGVVSLDTWAQDCVKFHRDGISVRREIDATAEKYAIHYDGEGDGQWADLYDGLRIEIPPPLGQIRQTENLLRPITDNAVSYHTTMPFRFVVEASQDREAAQRAMVDQAIVNHLSGQQRWNRAFAEAMQIAMCYGSCPIHAFWRDDLNSDPYEPVYAGDNAAGGQQGQQQRGPRRGMIDTFVGDPWATVYNVGAKRNSRHRQSWERSLPAALVQAAFPDRTKDLKGSTKITSAARWQRTARKWAIAGLSRHGSATMHSGRGSEEMIALLCNEIAPNVDPRFPDGRITLVALQGSATIARGETSSGSGKAIVLHDGPLPARRFSSVIVYSANRFDDIHGKPFVGDLDDLQIALNQGLSARADYLRRAIKPPLVEQGMVSDTAVWEDDARLEIDPSAQFQPYFLQAKVDAATLNKHIEEARQGMFTIGGYQAASRGESNPGDAASKVRFLAQADDTIHGPTNQRFREAVEEYAGLCHALFREYADVPWLTEVTGAELAHLIDPWIDRSMVSEETPSIKLVSGFGATTASKMTELTNLVTTPGADGEPLMTTRQFQSVYPDQSTYPEGENIQETRERRAKVINARLRTLGKDLEQRLGETAMRPEMLFMQDQAFMGAFPVQADDDPLANFNTLSSITQSEVESEVTRKLASYRQAVYGQWCVMLGMIPQPMVPWPNALMELQAAHGTGPKLVQDQPQQPGAGGEPQQQARGISRAQGGNPQFGQDIEQPDATQSVPPDMAQPNRPESGGMMARAQAAGM